MITNCVLFQVVTDDKKTIDDEQKEEDGCTTSCEKTTNNLSTVITYTVMDYESDFFSKCRKSRQII